MKYIIFTYINNGYYYIFAKEKENTDYANIKFSMKCIEDNGTEYEFEVVR